MSMTPLIKNVIPDTPVQIAATTKTILKSGITSTNANNILNTSNAKIENVYTTLTDKTVFNKMYATIFNNQQNQESLNTLESKLKTIINDKSNNQNHYQTEMINLIKSDVMNRITDFTGGVDPKVRDQINVVKDMVIDAFFNVGNNDLQGLTNQTSDNIKNSIKDAVNQTVNQTIDDCINRLSGDAIRSISANLYFKDINEYVDVSGVAGQFINNVFSDVSNTVKDTLSQFIEIPIDPESGAPQIDVTSVMDKLGENLNVSFDTVKSSAMSAVSNIIRNGIDTIGGVVSQNINNVFCEANQMLDEYSEYLDYGSKALSAITGQDIDINAMIKNAQDEIRSNVNNIINEASNSVTDATNGKKDNQSKTGTNPKTKQEIPPTNQPNDSVNQVKNKVQTENNKKSADIQQKKEQRKNEIKEKQKKDKKPDDPKPQTYDNSKPTPAKIKQADPRRKGCQELVLYEKPGSEYVLIRDGKGNYLLLDEVKNNIRLQHSSGSYIELRTSGDIMIEAASRTIINTAGANYIEKF